MHAYTVNEQQNCRTFSRGRLISKTTFVFFIFTPGFVVTEREQQPIYLTIIYQVTKKANNNRDIRGVFGNKCAGHHNLKTVQIREIMWK